MFPWLKPANDNYGQQKQNTQQDRKISGQRMYENNSHKQNQSDFDLKKGQKLQYDQGDERKYEEKEFNQQNHSKSDNRLNQDKYYPSYDNVYSNLKLESKSGRVPMGERNQLISKSPVGGGGINFEQDYKHQVLDKNKQSYKDYYRDNVSQFQKNKSGNHIQTNEDKKVKLQNVYQPDRDQGIVNRMSQNQRTSFSPQQKQQEYADILRRQIEEKKELMKQKQRREEDNDFQNKYQRNERDNNYRNDRDNYNDDRQSQEQYENKKQQNKKNADLDDQQEHSNQNNRKKFDLDQGYEKEFSSPPKYQQSFKNDQRGNYNHQNNNDEYERDQRINRDNRKDFNNDTQKKSILRNNSQDEYEKMKKKRWDDNDDFNQNLMGRMNENNDREQQIKKEKEMKYYKQLEEEIDQKRGRRDNSEKDDPWNKNEKSMLEQIGDNYKRQKELHLQQKAEIANELQQQIKDKKRQQRLEKEKQDLIERQYEERVKAEVQQLKVKYQQEMQGKQLEIKSLRKNVEKKKQEQIQQQGELVLSKSSKPGQRGKVENSPRVINNQNNAFEDESNGYNQKESAQDIERKSQNDLSQNDLNLQGKDFKQQNNNESREKQRDNLYKQQQEYYENREVNQEWNPPSFWQYKERKNNQELSQLKDQLDMQTSMLQNEAQRIRQDVQVANEMKSQALIDLENLKDNLRRQNMIDNVKLRELRQNMGSFGNVQSENQFMQNASGLGGSQMLPNQSVFQLASTKNINNNNNLLNQSSFSQNLNYSQLGNSNIYNNNFNSNKYGLQQPDILDKLISTNMNTYRFEGTRLNSQPATLDFKLEQRLNNVHLNKAEIQLLEVDNLLNNIRYGL